MSLEAWNTIGTLGTFVVIAATAIAAMIQLRHARGSNQIAVFNELRASQSAPNFVRAVQFVYSELQARMQDPEFRYQLANRPARTEKYNEAISLAEMVGDSYENIGVLAKTGLVDRGPLLDFYSAVVLDAWGALSDVTAVLRAHCGRYGRISNIWRSCQKIGSPSIRGDRTPATFGESSFQTHGTTPTSGMRQDDRGVLNDLDLDRIRPVCAL